MRIINKIKNITSNFYRSKQGLNIAFSLWLMSTLFFGYQLTKVEFDFDFESFFPLDHPDLETFENYKSLYDYDNDFLLIAIQNKKGLFNSDFLSRLKNAGNQIRKEQGTIEIVSPIDFQLPIVTSVGFSKISLLHPENSSKLKSDSLRLTKNNSIERLFFNKNLDALLLRIKHEHFKDVNVSNAYVNRLDEILNNYGIEQYYVAGRTSVQAEFISLIQSDFALFIGIAFLIIICFLKWQYKHWKSVFIPLLLIGSTIVVSLGLMVFLGYQLNILTVLIPTIISFVAISDVIHFYTKYQMNLEKKDKLILTIKEIGPATFLTSFTTAVGFISLATIDVLPIKLLGIYTAIGVSIAFVFTFILLPFFSNQLIKNTTKQNIFWSKVQSKLFHFTIKHQNLILYSTIVVTILAIIGTYRIKIDAYLLDDLPNTSFSKKSFEFLDQNHGGTKPWNLLIKTKNQEESINDLSILEALEKIELYLEDTYGLTNIDSQVKKYKLLNQIQNGGNFKFFTLPNNAESLNKLIKLNKRLNKRTNLKLIEDNDSYTKISGFIPEWGSIATAEKDNTLMNFITNESISKHLTFQITGTTYLIDRSHEFLSESLFYGLLFAFGTVALVSMLLFRSFKMILITLLPNILPVLITAAIIGYLGIPIKLTTSIIFAISFGIAVDDTIHFISRFRIESKKYNTVKSLENTFNSAGKAIIITTIVLSLGFGIFCFSSFGATFFTGFFIVLTLISALIVDLLLLPVLLIKFFNK